MNVAAFLRCHSARDPGGAAHPTNRHGPDDIQTIRKDLQAMKKRNFIIILGVLLTFLLLPMTALADEPDYFTITNTTDNAATVTWKKDSRTSNITLQYRIDGGAWQEFSITSPTGNTIDLPAHTSIRFKGTQGTFSTGSTTGYYRVSCNQPHTASGDVTTLLDGVGGAETVPAYAFSRLFYDDAELTSAKDLVLPATTLAKSCYYEMFFGCAGLTAAPALPATTLAQGCYNGMFRGCASLTAAPALPATTLADSCYYAMFGGCAGLTAAPALPAETMTSNCYFAMFKDCTGLTAAPALPAMTLAKSCYNDMFEGCTGLTAAPALPATTMANSCYGNMFQDCTGLTAAPALPATTLESSCYYHMFEGCTGLTAAPALPATALANSCYRYMFKGCTGLTAAPELPATTVALMCYGNMFEGCTGLTDAPALPATALASFCYENMFNGCTKLSSVNVGFSAFDVSNATTDWLVNVSATGTAYVPEDFVIEARGASTIPQGWKIVGPSDYHSATNGCPQSKAEDNHGYLTVNRDSALEHENVMITVTPNAGYQLKEGSLKVTYNDGEVKTIIPAQDAQDETKYTFTMPACEVKINAVFVEVKTVRELLNTVDFPQEDETIPANAWITKNGKLSYLIKAGDMLCFNAEQDDEYVSLEEVAVKTEDGYVYTCRDGKNVVYTVLFRMTDDILTAMEVIGNGEYAAFNGTYKAPAALAALRNIKIKKMPDKLTYDEGETFDPTGMIVEATYEDESKKPVTDYTFAPDGALMPTDNLIKISYTEDYVTKTAQVTITVTPAAPITYKIIQGAHQTIDLKAASALFTSNADFSKFDHVEVDGKTVAKKYYAAKSGSTEILLNQDFIQTLTLGQHTLTIVSTDGSASTDFTVMKDAPLTGDSTDLTLLTMLMLGSMGMILLFSVKAKKRES